MITNIATNVSYTTATVGGNVTSDGGLIVTERGVCYSNSNSNPIMSDNTETFGSGIGTFTFDITDLVPGVTYYVRAYAINDKGTSYGDVVTFKTKVFTYESVDLGLSVKWAAYNVGATKPEGYGDYYAWGEVSAKAQYEWSTYEYCIDSHKNLTKYNNNNSNGTVDNKSTLDSNDDVAHVKWGGQWRMPTKEEINELRNNCTWTWTTLNGVDGYQLTSKKSGYTNKSIFLPLAGYMSGWSLLSVESIYWSSTIVSSQSYSANLIGFRHNTHFTGSQYRFVGGTVRPVCPK